MSIKKKLQSKILDIKQKQVTKAYNKQGLTDEILNKQIQINKKRNELNISETEKGEFVQ